MWGCVADGANRGADAGGEAGDAHGAQGEGGDKEAEGDGLGVGLHAGDVWGGGGGGVGLEARRVEAVDPGARLGSRRGLYSQRGRDPVMDTPKIPVLLPVWNGRRHLERLLPRLEAQVAEGGMEVPATRPEGRPGGKGGKAGWARAQ